MQHADELKRIGDLIKDIRIAMLVTLDSRDQPRSRPMATQSVPFDGVLWFFTSKDSSQVSEISRRPHVNLAYSSPSSESYLSVTGTASVLDDRQKIHEFWSPFLRSWFESADDPTIRLLRIDVDEVEYWDTPGGKVASLYSLVKGAITGKTDEKPGEHQKVVL